MPGMKETMTEFKKGALRSGSKAGPVVKNRAQAIAIGLNEQRAAGGGAPPGFVNQRKDPAFLAHAKAVGHTPTRRK